MMYYYSYNELYRNQCEAWVDDIKITQGTWKVGMQQWILVAKRRRSFQSKNDCQPNFSALIYS